MGKILKKPSVLTTLYNLQEGCQLLLVSLNFGGGKVREQDFFLRGGGIGGRRATHSAATVLQKVTYFRTLIQSCRTGPQDFDSIL